MNPSITTYIVGFAASLGALIDGTHGALIGVTLTLGVAIVLAIIGAAILAGKTQEAQAELADLMAQGGTEWSGIPSDFDVDPQSGIPVERKTDDA